MLSATFGKLRTMMSPNEPDVAPNDPELARQAERLVAQTTPIRASNELAQRHSSNSTAAARQEALPRRRPASPAPVDFVTQRPRLHEDLDLRELVVEEPNLEPVVEDETDDESDDEEDDDRRGVVFPHIAGHRLVAYGRVEFLVQFDQDPSNDEWLLEQDIDRAVVDNQLHNYRVNYSGVGYDGKGGNFGIAEVLDHRITARGELIYFVSWAGRYSDPVWRSEAINPQDMDARLYEQYNVLNGLPPL